jgi:hypothetical protein
VRRIAAAASKVDKISRAEAPAIALEAWIESARATVEGAATEAEQIN